MPGWRYHGGLRQLLSACRSSRMCRSRRRGCPALGVRCWVLGVGCWVLGVGCWVLGMGTDPNTQHPTPNTQHPTPQDKDEHPPSPTNKAPDRMIRGLGPPGRPSYIFLAAFLPPFL